MATTVGLSKVFILDKYFTELQKFWETEKRLQGKKKDTHTYIYAYEKNEFADDTERLETRRGKRVVRSFCSVCLGSLDKQTDRQPQGIWMKNNRRAEEEEEKRNETASASAQLARNKKIL